MNAQFFFQTHPGDWAPQIFLDVIGEGAQGRNVNTAHARVQHVGFKISQERIKNTKKAGKRFPASGWRGQQNRFVVENRGNAEQLGVGETGKTREKPIAQARMQSFPKRFHAPKQPSSRAKVEGSRRETLKVTSTEFLIESTEHRPMPVRPKDILSAVSDSTEARTLLPSVQRSATPLGAQTPGLCSDPARVDGAILRDSPENVCS